MKKHSTGFVSFACKSLYSVLCTLSLCLLLSSCGDNKGGVTALHMSWTDLTLAPEESVRLYCKAEPEGTPVQLTWTSDNPDVASVDNIGYVTGHKAGKAIITASVDDKKAICTVIVESSYLATLEFTGAAMVGEPDTAYFGRPVIEGTMGGKTVYVYLSMANFLIFSDGLYLNEDGELDGSLLQGAVISVSVPMLYGPRELNGGKSVGSIFNNLYTVDGSKAVDERGYAQPGRIDEKRYISALKKYCEGSNEHNKDKMFAALDSAAKAITGATLSLAIYRTRDEGYPSDGFVIQSLPEAMVLDGSFMFKQNGVNAFTFGLEKFEMTIRPLEKAQGYYYGSALDYDPAKGLYYLADEQVHYQPDIHYKKK